MPGIWRLQSVGMDGGSRRRDVEIPRTTKRDCRSSVGIADENEGRRRSELQKRVGAGGVAIMSARCMSWAGLYRKSWIV